MRCPFCSAEDTKVIDSRLANEGDQVRRRRECLTCGERFTTFESAELHMPKIVKSSLPHFSDPRRHIVIAKKYRFLNRTLASVLELFRAGCMKTIFSRKKWMRSGLEMMIIGIGATVIIYFIVTFFLFRIISNF